jgi:hypothetical protein
MDELLRHYSQTLHTVGVLPAERAFELLTHRAFDFETATTAREKRRSLRKAERWLADNLDALVLDKRRGFYTTPDQPN